MSRRRHIEITAFRRQVTVIRDVNSSGGTERPLPSDDDQLSADTNLVTAPYLDPAKLTTIDAACSPDLLVLVEAFVKSNGDSTLAAQELHLSRSSFYLKLRKLGLSLSQLRAQLNTMRIRLSQGRGGSSVEKR